MTLTKRKDSNPTTPDAIVLALGKRLKKLRKKYPGEKFYLRLSLRTWRPFRAWMNRGLEVVDRIAEETDDKMPNEYEEPGVLVHGCRIAIQKSKLSIRLRRSGHRPVSYL